MLCKLKLKWWQFAFHIVSFRFFGRTMRALHLFILFVRAFTLVRSWLLHDVTLAQNECVGRLRDARFDRGSSKIRLVNEIIVANCSFGMVLFSSLTDFMRRTLARAAERFKRNASKEKTVDVDSGAVQ